MCWLGAKVLQVKLSRVFALSCVVLFAREVISVVCEFDCFHVMIRLLGLGGLYLY